MQLLYSIAPTVDCDSGFGLNEAKWLHTTFNQFDDVANMVRSLPHVKEVSFHSTLNFTLIYCSAFSCGKFMKSARSCTNRSLLSSAAQDIPCSSQAKTDGCVINIARSVANKRERIRKEREKAKAPSEYFD